MADLTRRYLVQRGALLAGAAGAASIAGIGGLERAIAAVGGPTLTAQRQATHAALVEAVALSDKLDVSADDLDGTTARFGELYAGSDGLRNSADIVLDEIERAAGGFAAMGRRARLQQLRGWLGDKKGKAPGGEHWLTIAAVAMSMAALPFYEDASRYDSIDVAI